ncbi:YheC/YheD family protein [Paenibacillus sp. KQZ6P-2]|uniref:YheC/YheD family protein n=1 Tax=Paenibacillus mangrovi TaxID=2931978 RepID=A0A9X1WSX0_9BACL|nr:YheC/YheD family protein [Paenibacillus mangrovi]MCJ8014667.1 YheC/YheD family protein [Paenibacillus mangrovi]
MWKSKPRRTLMSKWTKTKVLLGSNAVRPFIPDTRKFSKSDLKAMLDSYNMVYVKPENGTFGQGVIRVEKLNSGEYTYQLGMTKKTLGDFQSLHSSLLKTTGKKSYLIQKGIYLLKYNNRRFDIRVMVQLSPKGAWETTGMIGRVAHPKKIVTNYHSGGTPTDVKSLLAAHLPPEKMGKTIAALDKLGVNTAKFLHSKYPGFRQIGLDIGFDRSWTPWIIEVNTNPDPYIFNQLKDKTMYRKVMRYRKALTK